MIRLTHEQRSVAVVDRPEVEEARSRLEASRADGALSLVLIEGGAGTGKTTALRTLLDTDATVNATVLRAECVRSAVTRRYGAARAIFGVLGPTATAGDPEMFRGLYRRALTLMETGPLVIAVDDLHWCDEPSLRWLGYLARRAAGMPLTVLLTVRTPAPARTHHVVEQDIGPTCTTMISLQGMGIDEIRRLVTRCMGEPPSERFLLACQSLSSGNPGALVRLLSRARHGGLGPDDSSVADLRQLGAGVARSVVFGWLAAQPAHVHQVARAIAVGGTTDGDLVSALSGVPAPTVEAAVGLLRDRGVLLPCGDDFAVSHVRDALVSELSACDLERLRERAARLFNDTGHPAWTVANRLLPLAGPVQAWMRPILWDAAQEAGRRGDPEAALRYLDPLVAESSGDLRLRTQAAGFLAHSNPDGALAHLRAALDLADSPRARVATAIQFGLTAMAVRRSAEAFVELAGALDALDAEGCVLSDPADRELRTMAEATLVLTGFDESSTIRQVRERVRLMVDPEGETPGERQLLVMKAVDGVITGRPVGEVVALARRSLPPGDAALSGWPVLAAVHVFTVADEIPEARSIIDRVLAHSRAIGASWSYCVASALRSCVLRVAGDLAGAAADAGAALDLSLREGWHVNVTKSSLALAAVCAQLGEVERAQASLDKVVDPRVLDFSWEGHVYLMARAAVRAQRGDVDGALRDFHECGRSLSDAGITNPLFSPWWAEAAILLADNHRAREAAPLAELATDLVVSWDVPRARGLELITGGLAVGGQAGIEMLAEAARVLARSHARFDQQRAEFVLGRELLGLGDLPGARKHLRSAADLAVRCGARTAAAEAERLLVAAGGRPRQAVGSWSEVLTAGERRVADLAASGATNREISTLLFVTVRTVEVHLTNIYRKLGISGRGLLPKALADTRPE